MDIKDVHKRMVVLEPIPTFPITAIQYDGTKDGISAIVKWVNGAEERSLFLDDVFYVSTSFGMQYRLERFNWLVQVSIGHYEVYCTEQLLKEYNFKTGAANG